MSAFQLPGFDLDAFVRSTLAEDLGEGGDITSQATIPADARFADNPLATGAPHIEHVLWSAVAAPDPGIE